MDVRSERPVHYRAVSQRGGVAGNIAADAGSGCILIGSQRIKGTDAEIRVPQTLPKAHADITQRMAEFVSALPERSELCVTTDYWLPQLHALLYGGIKKAHYPQCVTTQSS
jgi:hypothetical protein